MPPAGIRAGHLLIYAEVVVVLLPHAPPAADPPLGVSWLPRAPQLMCDTGHDDGREAFPGTADRDSVDQQHRTAFCALKRARVFELYKPDVFMDSGFMVDASLEVLRLSLIHI